MSKIGAFEPLNGYKNYSSPTTKPLKHGAFVYHEKEKTLQEQIAQKLEKIAHFIDILFSQSSGIEHNVEMLHRDLESLKNSLKTNPFEFNVTNLQVNENWIEEMRKISDDSKAQITDKNELKIFRKLSHTLTELDHLIKPKTLITPSIQPVRTSMKAKTTTAAKKTAHKPAKKLATAKKKTVAKTTKRPAVKAKTATKVAKKASPVKKKTTAAKKTVSKTSRPKTAAKKTVRAAVKKPTVKKIAAKKTTVRKAASKIVRKPAAKSTKSKRSSMSR